MSLPSNSEIVASCKRAGIPCTLDSLGGIRVRVYGDNNWVDLTNDLRPGSALFIVAWLGVLPTDWELARTADTVHQWYFIVPNRSAGGWDPDGCADTLAAACAAAGVAAFPEVKGGDE